MTQRNIVGILALVLVLSSCATQPDLNADDPPGFFMGFIHGLVSLFALIGSAFTDIRVYAFPNSGGWYDLGFVLGAALFYGGSGSGSSRAASLTMNGGP